MVKADRRGDEGGIGSETLTDETPERDDDGRACAAQGLRGCEDEYIFTGMSIRRHCRGLPSCFHKPLFRPRPSSETALPLRPRFGRNNDIYAIHLPNTFADREKLAGRSEKS